MGKIIFTNKQADEKATFLNHGSALIEIEPGGTFTMDLDVMKGSYSKAYLEEFYSRYADIVSAEVIVDGGEGGAAIPNQPASVATKVVDLKDDFNSFLDKLKDSGNMEADGWHVSVGLAPSPTEEVLVRNSAKVQSIDFVDGVATINVDLAELEESASSVPEQGTHKWLPVAVNTGLSTIVGVTFNGGALTKSDADEAASVGIPTGGFVLYVKAEEAVSTPYEITLGDETYGDFALTIKVANPE